MNDEPKVQKAYIGDVEFNIADLTNLTMVVLDSLVAVASVMNPEAGKPISALLVRRADEDEAAGNTGSAALFRAAAQRISPSGSWPDPSDEP